MGVTETHKVTCPSGLVGEVRALKVAEILAMQDPKLLRQGKVFNQLVANCWVSTVDPGPYQFDTTQPPPWPTMLHSDKLVIIRDIRAMTGGPDYEFEMKCAACAHRYVWVQPLHDLKIRPMPQASIERVRNRQSFFADVGADKVEFRQLLNADDEQLVRLTRDGFPATTSGFLCRLIGVRTADGNVLSEVQEFAEWIANLDPIAFDDLEEAMDETDGGLDMSTVAVCPKCENEEGVIVPLLQSISRQSIRRSNQLAKAKMGEQNKAAGSNSTTKTPTQNPPTDSSGQTSSPSPGPTEKLAAQQ
jgi:hypothetical protein